MKRFDGTETVQQAVPDILYDESRYESGTPSSVCYPESVEELRAVLIEATSKKQPVTFVGAQTGTTGGAVPVDGCCAVAFSSMKRIVAITADTPSDPVLVCEPGITLDEIGQFLEAPREWPYKVPGIEVLEAGKWMYPPDPTEMTAQLGGTVATNASGARSYLYGPTRDHVAFIDIVFADGSTATLLRKNDHPWNRRIVNDQGRTITLPGLPYKSLAIKNAAGYYNMPDMTPADPFIGSEGTLGALARIGIQLKRKPEMLAGLTFFSSAEQAFDFADFLRKEPDVAAVEFFDEGSLRFIDHYRNRLPESFPLFPQGAAAALLWEFIEKTPGSFESRMERWEERLVGCGSSFDDTWSGFDEKEKQRLHHFRHALPETVNSIIAENKKQYGNIRKVGTDSAFPGAVFRAMYAETMNRIRESGLAFAAFGHLGDYHLHINLIPSTSEELDKALALYADLMRLAVDNGGTVSAEHGIGKIKKMYLLQMYGTEGIEGMKRLKTALDPLGLLNPGNLF